MLFTDMFLYLKCSSCPVLFIVRNKVCGRKRGSGRLFVLPAEPNAGQQRSPRQRRKYREISAAAPVDGPLPWQLEWQQLWWFKSTRRRPLEAISSIPESNIHQKVLRVGLKRPDHSRRTVAALLCKSVQVSREFYDCRCLSLAGPASWGSPWTEFPTGANCWAVSTDLTSVGVPQNTGNQGTPASLGPRAVSRSRGVLWAARLMLIGGADVRQRSGASRTEPNRPRRLKQAVS